MGVAAGVPKGGGSWCVASVVVLGFTGDCTLKIVGVDRLYRLMKLQVHVFVLFVVVCKLRSFFCGSW